MSYETRKQALELAIKANPDVIDAEVIVADAQRFERFLDGEEPTAITADGVAYGGNPPGS